MRRQCSAVQVPSRPQPPPSPLLDAGRILAPPECAVSHLGHQPRHRAATCHVLEVHHAHVHLWCHVERLFMLDDEAVACVTQGIRGFGCRGLGFCIQVSCGMAVIAPVAPSPWRSQPAPPQAPALLVVLEERVLEVVVGVLEEEHIDVHIQDVVI